MLPLQRPMVSSSATASGGSVRSAAAMFSRRWAREEVPGMSAMVADRCNNQARATCWGEAFRREATSVRVCDWSGEKPPRGLRGDGLRRW